jgi:predicted butyrate kinase (DUF1464 family)
MQYFSKRFTMSHIIPNVELPSEVEVLLSGKAIKVKMVMDKSKVKGKAKGGAMITSNWKQLVKLHDMRVSDIFIFAFGRSVVDGEFKMVVDRL